MINSSRDLRDAYEFARDHKNGRLNIHVSKRTNRFIGFAASFALWNFFRPLPAFATSTTLQTMPILTLAQPLRISLLGKIIAGAVTGALAAT